MHFIVLLVVVSSELLVLIVDIGGVKVRVSNSIMYCTVVFYQQLSILKIV